MTKSDSAWLKSDLGYGESYMRGLSIGDGDNDGENEVYAANANAVDNMHQFKWNGTGWVSIIIGGCNDEMYGVVLGDGDNDGENEVYSACSDDGVHQFNWNGTVWKRTFVWNEGTNGIWAVAIGDGDNDNEMEIYAGGFATNINQLKWNGTVWINTTIGSASNDVKHIVIGDADGDGKNGVYIASSDSYVYEFKWNGTVWRKVTLGSGSLNNSMNGLSIGDGDNDGENEVYAANADNEVYQFIWNNTGWQRTAIGLGTGDMQRISIGDGDNDGENEVYAASSDNRVYQFKFINGSSWIGLNVGRGDGWMMDLSVHDADNDGKNEVYAANEDHHVYQFNMTQIIDTYQPSIVLNSPENYHNTSRNLVIFNFTVIDNSSLINICNLTVSGIYVNSTLAINNTPTRLVNMISEGQHTWNISCVDNSSNLNTSSNRLLTVDSTPPNIYLIAPGNNTTELPSSNIVFEYNVSDISSVSNCSLILNDNVNQTNMNILKNVSQNFTQRLSNGSYNWTTGCSDILGNSVQGTVRTLMVDKPTLYNHLIQNLFNTFNIEDLTSYAIMGSYVDVNIVAWADNYMLVGNIMSNFSSTGGMLTSNIINLSGSGGIYSNEVIGMSFTPILNLISEYLKGIPTFILDTNPPILWHSAIIVDRNGNVYNNIINETLPTIFDSLPPVVTGDVLIFDAYSPVNIIITDPLGNRTGHGLNEIPHSVYTGPDAEPEFVAIFDPIEGNYMATIYGNQSGTYSFSVNRIRNGDVTYKRDRINISITQGDVHIYVDNISIYETYVDCRMVGCPQNFECDSEGVCVGKIIRNSSKFIGGSVRRYSIEQSSEYAISIINQQMVNIRTMLKKLTGSLVSLKLENSIFGSEIEDLLFKNDDINKLKDSLTGQLVTVNSSMLGTLIIILLSCLVGSYYINKRMIR